VAYSEYIYIIFFLLHPPSALLTSCRFVFLQELAAHPAVPARMGAPAVGEDERGAVGRATGRRQRRAEDGVHVQPQLLQDGVRLQVGGLHVPAHGAHQGPPGRNRK